MTTMTLKKADTLALMNATDDVHELADALKRAEAARAKAIRRAAKNGATMREIASVVEISHQRVAQILNG